MLRISGPVAGLLLWASLTTSACAQTTPPGQATPAPAQEASALAPPASTIANGIEGCREADSVSHPGGSWGRLFGVLILMALVNRNDSHSVRAPDCLERLFGPGHGVAGADGGTMADDMEEVVQAGSGGQPLPGRGAAPGQAPPGAAPDAGKPAASDPNQPKPPPPDLLRLAELLVQAQEDAADQDPWLAARGRARLRTLAGWVTAPRRSGRE